MKVGEVINVVTNTTPLRTSYSTDFKTKTQLKSRVGLCSYNCIKWQSLERAWTSHTCSTRLSNFSSNLHPLFYKSYAPIGSYFGMGLQNVEEENSKFQFHSVTVNVCEMSVNSVQFTQCCGCQYTEVIVENVMLATPTTI